jgi:hypothetical protein
VCVCVCVCVCALSIYHKAAPPACSLHMRMLRPCLCVLTRPSLPSSPCFGGPSLSLVTECTLCLLPLPQACFDRPEHQLMRVGVTANTGGNSGRPVPYYYMKTTDREVRSGVEGLPLCSRVSRDTARPLAAQGYLLLQLTHIHIRIHAHTLTHMLTHTHAHTCAGGRFAVQAARRYFLPRRLHASVGVGRLPELQPAMRGRRHHWPGAFTCWSLEPSLT